MPYTYMYLTKRKEDKFGRKLITQRLKERLHDEPKEHNLSTKWIWQNKLECFLLEGVNKLRKNADCSSSWYYKAAFFFGWMLSYQSHSNDSSHKLSSRLFAKEEKEPDIMTRMAKVRWYNKCKENWSHSWHFHVKLAKYKQSHKCKSISSTP